MSSTPWKALVGFAIVVAGAVGAFAVYTFGRHDSGARRPALDPLVRTVTDVAGTHREYTLQRGDVAFRRQAAVRCEASGEGGFPNVFCTRMGRGGRYQFVFYPDSVVVWGPGGPDKVEASYAWRPRR